MMIYISAFINAVLLSVIFTPITSFIAKKIGAVDLPNNRKIHEKVVPRLGGVAIYLSFLISILIHFDYISKHIRGLIFGSLIIVICGIWDDIKELNYKTKLLFQLIASIVLMSHGVMINKVSILSVDGASFMNLGWLSIPISILWIIGVTNAVNLIDGLDGLACGLATISSVFLFIIFIFTGNPAMALMIIALAGSCLGFLPYNFNPARIFMGDTGSMFLGFILAGMSIQGTVKYATTIIMFIPLLIIGLPLYDTLVTMLRRFIQGSSIMEPDKQHFHHRMLSMGLNQKQVAILSYIVNIVLGILALIILFSDNSNMLIIILAITVITLFMIVENFIFTKKNNNISNSVKTNIELEKEKTDI